MHDHTSALFSFNLSCYIDYLSSLFAKKKVYILGHSNLLGLFRYGQIANASE